MSQITTLTNHRSPQNQPHYFIRTHHLNRRPLCWSHQNKGSINQDCHKRFYRHMFFWFIYFFTFETSATASCGYTGNIPSRELTSPTKREKAIRKFIDSKVPFFGGGICDRSLEGFFSLMNFLSLSSRPQDTEEATYTVVCVEARRPPKDTTEEVPTNVMRHICWVLNLTTRGKKRGAESLMLLMVQKSSDHQLRLVVLLLFTRFYTSKVVQDVFHQQ